MSKYKWITGASLLLLPGMIGITVHSAQKQSWSKAHEAASAAVSENPVSQDYLRMYEEWSRLPQDQKSENPWGQGQYGGPEIQKKLQEGQADRLLADLPDLQNNISHFPPELMEVMYGPNWRQTLEDYQADCGRAELLLIGSTFFLAGGAIMAVGGLLRWTVCSLFAKAAVEPDAELKPDARSGTVEAPSLQDRQDAAAETGTADPKPKSAKKTAGYFQNRSKEQRQAASAAAAAPTAKSSFMEQFSSAARPAPDAATGDNYFGWAVELEEKPEIKTLMTTEPLTKGLSDLTEEVSAIRHFAAQQQDQMRKLQDGYDWMIVRRFCLRIIRCIDNIEDRIAKLNRKEEALGDHLQDVRDELVFALESGGIEKYEPDLNVPYKGLERYAEAIKERIQTDETAKNGCIAQIVRSGYQYLVNDDDVKIVRCAQVKLYEFAQNQ